MSDRSRSSAPKGPELTLIPPTRTSLVESVVVQLQAAILGSMKPGDRLPSERVLCERLGVSRIVAREALRQLSERGLVDVQAGTGTFVRRVEPSMALRPLRLYIDQNSVSTAKLFEVRFLLETEVAARAADSGGGTVVAELESSVGDMEVLVARLEGGVADEEIVERFSWIDVEFHMLLARATGNDLFEALLTPLIGALIRVRRQGLSLRGTARSALDEHSEVLRRVLAWDSKGAANSMRDHLGHVQEWIYAVEAFTPKEA